jgi:hypothetical protein
MAVGNITTKNVIKWNAISVNFIIILFYSIIILIAGLINHIVFDEMLEVFFFGFHFLVNLLFAITYLKENPKKALLFFLSMLMIALAGILLHKGLDTIGIHDKFLRF